MPPFLEFCLARDVSSLVAAGESVTVHDVRDHKVGEAPLADRPLLYLSGNVNTDFYCRIDHSVTSRSRLCASL